jgi:hypothetical protein
MSEDQVVDQSFPEPKRPKLQCDECEKSFSTKSILTRHKREQHGGPGKYECNLCSRKFHRPEILASHLEAHANNRLNVAVTSIKIGEIEVSLPNPEELQICPICSKDYSTHQTLLRHMREQHESELLKEAQRKIVSVETDQGIILIRDDYGDEDIKCELCDSVLKGTNKRLAYVRHLREQHSDFTKVQCPQCGIFLTRKSHLTMHLDMHERQEQARTLCCDYCDEKFIHESERQQHQRSDHTGKFRMGIATSLIQGCNGRVLKREKGEVSLTEDWIKEKCTAVSGLQQNQGICPKTGIQFVFDDPGSPFSPSIDRIVNDNYDYNPNNCEVVCYAFNVFKRNWNHRVIADISRGFLHNYNKQGRGRGRFNSF